MDDWNYEIPGGELKEVVMVGRPVCLLYGDAKVQLGDRKEWAAN